MEVQKILWGLVLAVALLFLLYLLAIMPRMINRPNLAPFRGWLYAHRGLHDNGTDAPENSLRAFARAVEAGYGIELDVQLTKDRVPVVFHDFTLQRVCSVEGKVCDFTLEELSGFRLFGSDQGIPTFAQVLELVRGQVPLIVEYKIAAMDAEVCRLGDRLLREYPGVYCIESFHPLGVLWYKKNRNRVLRGILSDNYVRRGDRELPRVLYRILQNLMFNFLIKPDFIAYNCKYHRDVSPTLCRKLYRAPGVAWTIQSQRELEERRKDYDLFIFEGFEP